ncbi:hypothetical protein [Streptomyces sp. RTd22]|uniref:hypothetical protein n=1 Tax=Streptomyces sp. RTd22 TaxID=1841249 RepID=UPI0007C43CF7|nr:hypothetical protein [Streptomyces sp. RTd22]
MEEQVEWHRKEFRGRESELSSITELAKREGVQPNTVSSWSSRHASFPEIVMTKRGAVTTKYYVTAEFDRYREIQRGVARQARTRKSAPPRSKATIARERLATLKAQDDKLAEEEKELSEKLAAVLRRRHQLDEEMGEVRRGLEKELATIQEALRTEQP